MTECQHDTIISDTNVGDDANVRVRVVVECDGKLATNCGFAIAHCDDEGREHDPHDWWVTAREMTTYSATHQVWSRMTLDQRAKYEADANLIRAY